jgi:hypothetical protein
MKALEYHELGNCGWEEKPKPAIKNSRDAIIRITKKTIILVCLLIVVTEWGKN